MEAAVDMSGQPTVGGLTGAQLQRLRDIGTEDESTERCEWSELLCRECAHCLGHVAIDYEGLEGEE